MHLCYYMRRIRAYVLLYEEEDTCISVIICGGGGYMHLYYYMRRRIHASLLLYEEDTCICAII